MTFKMYKWFSFIFFLCTLLLLFLYIAKPQVVNKTEVKEAKSNNPCTEYSYQGTFSCEASESCKSQGGRLKHFQDKFGHGPEFDCEY